MISLKEYMQINEAKAILALKSRKKDGSDAVMIKSMKATNDDVLFNIEYVAGRTPSGDIENNVSLKKLASMIK